AGAPGKRRVGESVAFVRIEDCGRIGEAPARQTAGEEGLAHPQLAREPGGQRRDAEMIVQLAHAVADRRAVRPMLACQRHGLDVRRKKCWPTRRVRTSTLTNPLRRSSETLAPSR